MKKLLVFLFLLASQLGSAQVGERVTIKGQVVVPAGDDPEGITVYNSSANRGTVTNETGRFQLPVALGDELVFAAIQFQEFSVVIDQRMIDARALTVSVREAVTELPEVVVSPTDLTGNIEVDVKRIPTQDLDLPEGKASEIDETEWDFRPDEQSQVPNAAMRNSLMVNGLNFANIFRAIFTARDAQSQEMEPLDENIRLLYDDEFFRENLAIKREEIHDFILFSEENGLTREMLEDGNQLDLIQFLMEQSVHYRSRRE